MKILETSWGFEIHFADIHVLLGGVESQIPALTDAFPQYEFKRLKQVHSDAVLKTDRQSPDYETLGDAHWTSEKDLALCVITADCVPALFYDPVTQLIAGAHAGWRGVASSIIPKTLKALISQGARAGDIHVFIGPHIKKKSFEVAIDVRDQILASLGPLSPSERGSYAEALSTDKYLVDLSRVVNTQLLQQGLLPEKINVIDIDTKTDSRFHSHRRDKEKAGRQVSFIVRK